MSTNRNSTEYIYRSRNTDGDPVVLVLDFRDQYPRVQIPALHTESGNVSLADKAASHHLSLPEETTPGVLIAELFAMVNDLRYMVKQLERQNDDLSHELQALDRRVPI